MRDDGKLLKPLEEFANDDNTVVKESCLVALDAADYGGNNKPETKDADEDEGGDDSDHKSVSNNASAPASSVQQKNNHEKPNRILVNHFNVQETKL